MKYYTLGVLLVSPVTIAALYPRLDLIAIAFGVSLLAGLLYIAGRHIAK